MKIGVMVDSFKLPLYEGILRAHALGADGIQLYAVSGQMSPENLTRKARRELLDYIKATGLTVSALCGDFGGHGFAIEEANPIRIERSKRILDLALDIDTKVVTTHIGVIPEDTSVKRYEIMQKACYEIGKYAENNGASFAVETGPEKAATLKKFLDTLNTSGVMVNLDPANFIMVTDEDPVKSVGILKDYIVHTHAKDGKMLLKTDPEIIYNYFAEGGIDDLHLGDYFLETPLGSGSVDFINYIQELRKINYNGYLTIEREVGADPEMDIREAVGFLKDLLKHLKG